MVELENQVVEQQVRADGSKVIQANVSGVEFAYFVPIVDDLKRVITRGMLKASGKGTYKAREALKAFGMRWNPYGKFWYKDIASEETAVEIAKGVENLTGNTGYGMAGICNFGFLQGMGSSPEDW